MKTFIFVLAVLFITSTIVFSCNCPTPACPDVTVHCGDNVISPPGLWEVTTGRKLCGEIVLGPSWVIIAGETILLNKVKRMISVETCD